MTDSTPPAHDSPAANPPPSAETGDGPWLAVLLGVALLLALFILLALIAG